MISRDLKITFSATGAQQVATEAKSIGTGLNSVATALNKIKNAGQKAADLEKVAVALKNLSMAMGHGGLGQMAGALQAISGLKTAMSGRASTSLATAITKLNTSLTSAKIAEYKSAAAALQQLAAAMNAYGAASGRGLPPIPRTRRPIPPGGPIPPIPPGGPLPPGGGAGRAGSQSGWGPFGFMIRYRIMASTIEAARFLAKNVVFGGSRAELSDSAYSLAAVGIKGKDIGVIENAAAKLGRIMPVNTKEYREAAAKFGGAEETSKERIGIEGITKATDIAQYFAKKAQLTPDHAADMLIRTYTANKDRSFKGMDPLAAMEQISATLGHIIEKSQIKGPQIQNFFRHALSSGAMSNWDVAKMAAYGATLYDVGQHAGQAGRLMTNIKNRPAQEAMAKMWLAGSTDPEYADKKSKLVMAIDDPRLKQIGIEKGVIKPGQELTFRQKEILAKGVNKEIYHEVADDMKKQYEENTEDFLAQVGRGYKEGTQQGYFKEYELDWKSSSWGEWVKFLTQNEKMLEKIKRLTEGAREAKFEDIKKDVGEVSQEEIGVQYKMLVSNAERFWQVFTKWSSVIGNTVKGWASMLSDAAEWMEANKDKGMLYAVRALRERIFGKSEKTDDIQRRQTMPSDISQNRAALQMEKEFDDVVQKKKDGTYRGDVSSRMEDYVARERAKAQAERERSLPLGGANDGGITMGALMSYNQGSMPNMFGGGDSGSEGIQVKVYIGDREIQDVVMEVINNRRFSGGQTYGHRFGTVA